MPDSLAKCSSIEDSVFFLVLSEVQQAEVLAEPTEYAKRLKVASYLDKA